MGLVIEKRYFCDCCNKEIKQCDIDRTVHDYSKLMDDFNIPVHVEMIFDNGPYSKLTDEIVIRTKKLSVICNECMKKIADAVGKVFDETNGRRIKND